MAKNDVIILVERETFEMEGKVYYSYFIKGTIRGRDVRAAVVPPDKGGYPTGRAAPHPAVSELWLRGTGSSWE